LRASVLYIAFMAHLLMRIVCASGAPLNYSHSIINEPMNPA
jgi:hypothetical protein